MRQAKLLHQSRDAARLLADLSDAASSGAHVIVSNAALPPDDDAIDGLLTLFGADPKLGFVVPRSPFSGRWVAPTESQLTPAESQLVCSFPGGHFIPSAEGPVVAIRDEIVAEFTQLLADAIHRQDVQGFSLELNEFGFRCAVANAVFVDCGADRTQPVQTGPDSIAERYQRLVDHHCELLLAHRRRRTSRRLLVDLSSLRSRHNGSSEAALALVRALVAAETPWHVDVACDPHVARYHRLSEILADGSVHEPSTAQRFDAVLRPALPYEFAEVLRIAGWAPINAYFVLDTIALDCAYLTRLQLEAVWRMATTHADLLLFNSQYTQRVFSRRFPDACVNRVVSPHSLSADDYAIESPLRDDTTGLIFVVGNELRHKYVAPTVDALAAAFPDREIVALGLSDSVHPNVRALPSGSISANAVDDLYSRSALVVYPSFYEGFGLPIAHALARGKHVVARRSELTEDFQRRWSGGGVLLLYRSTSELLAMIAEGRSPRRALSGPVPSAVWTWGDSAAQILETLERLDSSFDGRTYRRRLTALRDIDAVLTKHALRAATQAGTLRTLASRVIRLAKVTRRR